MRLIHRLTLAVCMLAFAAVPVHNAASAQATRLAAAAPATLLDLNTAAADQLLALPGIGKAYSARIIAGRPYTAKNQLVTRGILPQQVYARFQNGIIAKRTTK